ncbi:hypothetical protein M408DRAFT_333978 [Serendipita vermifera MAFF 305830]|uniref:Uncharacterized protein n=1 Tax=Serendipita vermifera MAFF 305830 TaxID=933852 RepID=A0A0C3AMB2_SERVB|nr:hypothetical protein M408DRAFT_333978 [Serendipita vermifera MAFF 305830]
MVTGHALLRLYFDGYLLFSLQESMQIGAVGVIVVYSVWRALYALVHLVEPENRESNNPCLCFHPAIFSGRIVGVVGSKLLNDHGH